MAIRSRERARHLFGGGLVFFMVGIVTEQVAILGFAIGLLVGALLCHWRNSRRPRGAP